MTRLATLDPAGGAAFRDRRIRTMAAGLAALYLWFVSAQPVVGYAHAGHDDELFLRLAEYIVNGQWLGPYSQFTLMKGCGYPLFIAGVFKLGLPLPLAEHSFYLLGCWLLVRALRPLLRNDAWSLTAFALLLWQPMSYYLDRGGGNILRQNLYTPLTLLIFAGLVALHTRRHARLVVQLGWMALLGLSLGGFWLTREEGVWIIPSAALLVAIAGYFGWREKIAWRRLAGPLAFAAATAVLPVLIVCRLNAKYYGWFGLVECRAPQFMEAYGALGRVQVSPPIDRVPLPRESRRAIYPVSPSFARLQPLLEGDLGVGWVGSDLQFNGGMWMWALRDAVVDTIHPRNAAETLAFYQKLADEVNAACDAGRIPAGPRHDSFLPPLTPHYRASLRQDLPWYLQTFVQFEGFNARPRRSSGNALELRLFRDLTHSPLAPADDAPEIALPLTWADRVWRIGALQDIGRTLRWLCVTAEVAGLMAWLWVAGRALRGRRAPEYLWWLATAACLGALAVFAISLLVHVTSWPDWRPLRFSQAYPLLMLFSVTALAATPRTGGWQRGREKSVRFFKHAWHSLLAGAARAPGIAHWRRWRHDDPVEGWLCGLLIAASAVKLWLAAGQPQYAIPVAPYDDRLSLRLATYLLEGHWLGPYDQLTLAKGPFYPLFMAGTSLLRLPLTTAHNLVYIVAGWLFVRALRPLWLPAWTRAALLLAILACPVLSDTGAFVRAWRQPLWPGLVMLSVAGTMGLALRAEARAGRQAAWALLAGTAMGAMWLTREEAVWTLPMLALPLLVAAWRGWRARVRARQIIFLAAPFAVAALAVGGVAAENWRVYGFWGVVEYRDDSFVAAYSALCRVEPHDLARRVPVTRAARERIYAVSPAFAELRYEMEEGIGAAFMKVTQDNVGIPAAEHEIGSGWLMWALRDAVARNGHAKTAPEARAFYRRLAAEVNTACDSGLLPALPRRHTMLPPWHPSFAARTWTAAGEAIHLIMDYPFNVEPIPSWGSPEDLAWVERITHERVAPSDPGKTSALRSPRRLAILQAFMGGYRHAMRWLLPAATLVWLFCAGRAFYRRTASWLLVLSTALALGIMGNVAVVALVEATSWPAIHPGYLGASVPLAVCFVGVVFIEFVSMLPTVRAGR